MTLLVGLVAATADCGSSSSGSGGSAGSTATTTTTATGTGGMAGMGGTTNSGGGGAAACLKCAELLATADPNPTVDGCPGNTQTLILAVVQCTCDPAQCGGTGKACEHECDGTATSISDACKACDQTAAAGPCQSQFAACAADQ